MITLWGVAMFIIVCQSEVTPARMAPEDFRPSILIPLRVQLQQSPYDTEWMREGQLLARFSRGRCSNGCNETIQVFSNGSLWLNHVGREAEGSYLVKVYNDSGFAVHEIAVSVQIIEIPADLVLGRRGFPVLLPLGVQSLDSRMGVLWKREERRVGDLYRRICVMGCNNKSNVFHNGSFLLNDVQSEDAGRYSAEVHDGRLLIHQTEILLHISNDSDTHNCTESPDTPWKLSLPLLILLCEAPVFLILLVILTIFTAKFLCRRREQKRGSVKQIVYAQVKRRKAKKTPQGAGRQGSTKSDNAQEMKIYEDPKAIPLSEEMRTFQENIQ
ncbi:uncharacterized protein [Hyperolius riggenbachi]|uniref:uncharacterized protein isoform X2 n=1 Tax=Hyperolius riggenbachi TaxID=752182 RepID=UPI0035A2BB27